MKRSLAILSVTIIPLLFSIIPLVTSAKLIEFKNPILSGDAMALIQSVVNQLFPLAIMIVTFMIIIFGFLYVYYSSQGDQGGLKKLHQSIPYLIFGIALVAGAKVIIEAVKIFGEGIK